MIFQWFDLAWDPKITSLMPSHYCHLIMSYVKELFKRRGLLPLFQGSVLRVQNLDRPLPVVLKTGTGMFWQLEGDWGWQFCFGGVLGLLGFSWRLKLGQTNTCSSHPLPSNFPLWEMAIDTEKISKAEDLIVWSFSSIVFPPIFLFSLFIFAP